MTFFCICERLDIHLSACVLHKYKRG